MKSLPTDPSSESKHSAGHCGRKLALAWSATDGTPAMVRIAFATDDRVTVNQHFGAAVGFAIYALDGEHARLVQLAEYPPASMDGNENKLAEKIAALAGCAAVYCLAAGGSAVRQLLANGIQPVRLNDEEGIDGLLVSLRQAIREGGIAWLDKHLKPREDNTRFDRMAEEGWQE